MGEILAVLVHLRGKAFFLLLRGRFQQGKGADKRGMVVRGRWKEKRTKNGWSGGGVTSLATPGHLFSKFFFDCNVREYVCVRLSAFHRGFINRVNFRKPITINTG